MEIHNSGHILVNTDDTESFKVSKSTFVGSRNTMGASNFLSFAYFIPDQGSHYRNSRFLPYLDK